MFRKVHIKLSLLFTLVSSLILAGMSILFLFVQTNNLKDDTKNKLQQNINSFLYSFENNHFVSYDWLKSVEQNYGYELFIFDNGVPMRFMQDTKSESEMHLIEVFQIEYPNAQIDARDAIRIIRFETDTCNYYVGVVSLQGNLSETTLYIMLSLQELESKLHNLYYQFAIINAIGILLLFFFSWVYTKKLLKPIRASQQRQIDFIAAASHEIRNPVNTITSALGAMDQANETQKAEFLRIAKQEGERLSFLTNDLLTLARSDSQSIKMNFGTAELDTIVLECYEAFSLAAKDKKLSLTVSLAEEALIAEHADSNRLRQVITILLDNAISYTSEHGKIAITCKKTKNELVISVADNGVGLTDEQKLHVFDRFYRADESRHNKSHFGLGLSIAKEIIDLHHGKITITDTPGGGATFTVSIPE